MHDKQLHLIEINTNYILIVLTWRLALRLKHICTHCIIIIHTCWVERLSWSWVGEQKKRETIWNEKWSLLDPRARLRVLAPLWWWWRFIKHISPLFAHSNLFLVRNLLIHQSLLAIICFLLLDIRPFFVAFGWWRRHFIFDRNYRNDTCQAPHLCLHRYHRVVKAIIIIIINDNRRIKFSIFEYFFFFFRINQMKCDAV